VTARARSVLKCVVQVEREDTVAVKPAFFGQKIQDHIMKLLREKVEGKCSGRFGYTVLVTAMPEIGEGRLVESGDAHFKVKYVALVFRPMRNEVLQAVVTTVNSVGFFAHAGPCKIFVSRMLVPADLHFDSAGESACFVSEDEDIRIESGSQVRVKIVGIRLGQEEISVIGTIKEDYLGPLITE
jgi:DNA-directed RNA polymerase II subunit RPB7